MTTKSFRFVVSHYTFDREGMRTSRRRVFRSLVAARRQEEKWARKSIRRFDGSYVRITREQFGMRVGLFPFQYVRVVTTLAA